MPPKKGKKGGKDKGECSYHQNNSIGAVLRYNASAVLSTVNNQGVPPLEGCSTPPPLLQIVRVVSVHICLSACHASKLSEESRGGSLGITCAPVVRNSCPKVNLAHKSSCTMAPLLLLLLAGLTAVSGQTNERFNFWKTYAKSK